MLSRSNSNAGERLRRAKSSSSTHTTATTWSGHQRSNTSIDPFVVRQQAEVAAVEAFQRARQYEEPVLQAYNPVPSKLQRRRNHATGRAEGSHFEDARLGRRKSNASKKTKDDGHDLKVSVVPPRRPVRGRSDQRSDDTAFRQKVEASKTKPVQNANSISPSVPPPPSSTRRTWTEYTEGSPAPHRQSTDNDRSASLLPISHRTPRNDDNRGPLHEVSSFGELHDVADQIQRIDESNERHSIGDWPPPDTLAQARDQCLQDFHHKRLRERKSFIAGTIQKFRGGGGSENKRHGGGGPRYDTSLPPFNYADAAGFAPPTMREPSPLPPPAHNDVGNVEASGAPRPRNFSDALKWRLKKVFRRPSRLPNEMPAQHVEARQLHYSAVTPPPTATTTHDVDQVEGDPFEAFSAGPTFPAHERRESVHSHQLRDADADGDTNTTDRSRVSSWENSTTIGTNSTAAQTSDSNSVDENGRLRRSDSTSTLRKARSFLGRPIRNKLRRPSKTELTSSEESAALYSALQERINPGNQLADRPASRPESRDEESISTRPISALSTLPSQQKQPLPLSQNYKSTWAAPTIRPVTPDPNVLNKSDILSPVAEVFSPPQTLTRTATHQDTEEDDETPRQRLHRRPAMKAVCAPSKEQIARRIERTHNRWQAPLDDFSPSSPRPTRSTTIEDNPYELRSLKHRQPLPEPSHDRPYHAKINPPPASQRNEMFSPSVYSRASDGRTPSPQPIEPADEGGMVVTITGHEVRSYPISPAKRNRRPEPINTENSREWRRWLSGELRDWNSASPAPELLPMPKSILKKTTPPTMVDSPMKDHTAENIANAEEERDITPSRALRPTSAETSNQRPRSKSKSRRASFMNERYPMFGSDDSSTSQGQRPVSVASRAETPSGPAALAVPKPRELESRLTDEEEHMRPSSWLGGGRVVSKRSSAVDIGNSDRRKSGHNQYEANQSTEAANIRNDQVSGREHEHKADIARRATQRAKSAFDLRANYKSGRASPSKPIEVYRRPAQPQHHQASHYHHHHRHYLEHSQLAENSYMLEQDNTIRKISAGPYAAGGGEYGTAITSEFPASSTRESNATRRKSMTPTYSDKENAAPVFSTDFEHKLPAVSSSEWLATRSSKLVKKQQKHQVTARGQSACGERRYDSSYSPAPVRPQGSGYGACNGSGGGNGGGSPGQRLVTGWLDAKKGRENSPGAFV